MKSAIRFLPFILLFALLVTLSYGPIRSYDYFWHLASGRWISEQHALPLTDPFAVASDRHAWINGEWLFQIALYRLFSVVGHQGVVMAKALVAAFIFTVVAWKASRVTFLPLTCFMTLVSWWGAARFLDVRPSLFGVLFLVFALLILERERDRKRIVLFAALTVLWINTHPSALLAPLIALLFEGSDALVERAARTSLVRHAALLVSASLAALLVNPFFIDGMTAPIALTTWVSSGTFTNREWLPSDPRLFPLLYLSALAGFFLLLKDRHAEHAIARGAIFLLLTALAVKSVRNQPLYFAGFLLLVAPSLRNFKKLPPMVGITAAGAAAVLAIAGLMQIRTGPLIPPDRFPVGATETLRRAGLGGTIFNADQFGGYLIWSFYPERRVLTDGRNELYRSFIPEDTRGRRDSRAWKALLDKYDVALAVDEYRPPIEVSEHGKKGTTLVPALDVFYPRAEWAVIGTDPVAVVLAKRRSFDASTLARIEVQRDRASPGRSN